MQRAPMRGMSFVDVIVGTSLILIIFLGLFGLLRASIGISQLTRAKAIATTVAESQMEYVRSLSYSSVGTIGGIPAGPIPQFSTTTSNGIAYGVRTFIDYADDPADGLGGADSNGIITDYKRIKVTASYTAGGKPRTVDIISNYSPIGIETTTGGGTLKLIIVNAAGAPVSGASVRIKNVSTSPTIDVTTFSDSTGVVYLPGAATSTEYQIYVSKTGYSSAQTYLRDATNQNPTPGYLTVVKDLTTASTFAIDILSSLTVRTFSPVATTTFSDTFQNSTNVAVLSNTQAGGGSVRLATGGNGYVSGGSALSVAIAPTYLAGWGSASSTVSIPPNTTAVYHVTDGAGTPLPDAVLPGNTAGFTNPVDLSSVSTSTYPSLALLADLGTTATTTTPEIQRWGITYTRGPIPLPNIPFTLTGTKTVGSTGAGAAIYKTLLATTTGATGSNLLSLEWDGYSMALTGYDTTDACNAPPYTLSPGTVNESSLFLVPATSNSLLVSVRDSANAAVPGATVTLSRAGYTSTAITSNCGGAYFGNLAASSAYTITVSKTGYTTDTNTNVNVSGHLFYADTL